ncbi:MAG TPA: UbiX family flavin prenyltransferase [Saprospiraceae bacterium]|nr:UbiX family flavin prenyltransferase [Saprospiraceae bacterium]
MKKIVLGISGSSGSIYARLLLARLKVLSEQVGDCGIVMSENARINWQLEQAETTVESFGFRIYGERDFNAPFASGSAMYETMIVCPCSMGTLGRIAHGVSNDLMTRAADVILKERRKLILVPRENPYSLIHLENMKTLTLAGGIICPATPSYYSNPKTIDEVAGTVVDRILDLAGFEYKSYRWGESEKERR